jgi:sulfate adenylyltransferase subunit 1
MRTLLRLATAGSVDDGKSTLVGRLLYDSKSVLADQFDAVERVSRDRGLETADLALLTDGLRSEREQGITIDVAYRYFATATRSFILADCPGHVQYTRNTVTGASTADVVVLLNKIDLVDLDEATYTGISDSVLESARSLGLYDVATIPVSALDGDNVVDRSIRTPWYDGPSLLEYLEQLSPVGAPHSEPLRFPVQLVIRPQSAAGEEFRDYRGYAGQIASGLVRVGDSVTVQPSGRTSTVAGIDTADGELTEAYAPQSITLRLEDDIDISRGDLIVTSRSVPPVTQDVDGTVAWLAEQPLAPGTKVLLKHGTRTVQAMVRSIGGKLDLDHARLLPADSLTLNDIGHVTLRLAAPIPAEEYIHARSTGAFLLIDAQDGGTLAAGMVGDALLDTKAAVDAIAEATVLA